MFDSEGRKGSGSQLLYALNVDNIICQLYYQ